MKNIHLLPTTPNDETAKGIWIKETRDWCNIYITSNEKPKAGDWSIYQNKIHKCIEDIIGDEFKKIILTTDQDLIKDGVQAIDDEFLEWFVNNPSCEEVEVSYEVLNPFQSIDKGYVLRLPDIVNFLEEPEQETLEEAAKNYSIYNEQINKAIQEAVKFGAKWEAKRRYSEEEVLRIIQDCKFYLSVGDEFDEVKWFEQFKKR